MTNIKLIFKIIFSCIILFFFSLIIKLGLIISLGYLLDYSLSLGFFLMGSIIFAKAVSEIKTHLKEYEEHQTKYILFIHLAITPLCYTVMSIMCCVASIYYMFE